jgi:hypothetical protein
VSPVILAATRADQIGQDDEPTLGDDNGGDWMATTQHQWSNDNDIVGFSFDSPPGHFSLASEISRSTRMSVNTRLTSTRLSVNKHVSFDEAKADAGAPPLPTHLGLACCRVD